LTAANASPHVIVITGIQASGKSTVARRLAKRFERGVHIEADVLYQMIVAGRVLPEEPDVMPPEAALQLRLRLHNACLLARSFHEAGFSVVIDEIIIGERYDHLKEELEGLPLDLIVLAPRPEVVAKQRDPGRSKRVLGEEWALYLDRELRATMAGIGIWIDNSDQTPTETVEQIARELRLDVTRSGPGSP
jgi:chloramphenicol 3-O-phosphotransferase